MHHTGWQDQPAWGHAGAPFQLFVDRGNVPCLHNNMLPDLIMQCNGGKMFICGRELIKALLLQLRCCREGGGDMCKLSQASWLGSLLLISSRCDTSLQHKSQHHFDSDRPNMQGYSMVACNLSYILFSLMPSTCGNDTVIILLLGLHCVRMCIGQHMIPT